MGDISGVGIDERNNREAVHVLLSPSGHASQLQQGGSDVDIEDRSLHLRAGVDPRTGHPERNLKSIRSLDIED